MQGLSKPALKTQKHGEGLDSVTQKSTHSDSLLCLALQPGSSDSRRGQVRKSRGARLAGTGRGVETSSRRDAAAWGRGDRGGTKRRRTWRGRGPRADKMAVRLLRRAARGAAAAALPRLWVHVPSPPPPGQARRGSVPGSAPRRRGLLAHRRELPPAGSTVRLPRARARPLPRSPTPREGRPTLSVPPCGRALAWAGEMGTSVGSLIPRKQN